MRAASLIAAVLVVLACTLTVSASSADWSAPEALWSSDLSASELEARHSEFLMDASASSTGASSSTGDASSSSSGAVSTPLPALAVTLACVGDACPINAINVKSVVSASVNFPTLDGELVLPTFTVSNSTNSSSSSSSSTGSVGARRLLQSDSPSTTMNLVFFGSSIDGGQHARLSYSAFTALLRCSDATCRQDVKKKYSLNTDLSDNSVLGQSLAAVAATVVRGSIKADPTTVAAGDAAAVVVANEAAAAAAGNREQATVGGPRKTNIGYYVLGAVALAFAVAALIYFIVHRAPKQHDNIVIKENRAPAAAPAETEFVPVVAAPVAATGVQHTPEVNDPAAGYQQQDYKSVFALKHNVLDEQKQVDEDHNHNDVHFILHQ